MPAAAQRRMLELVPFAAARNPIEVTGQFLNDPSLLGQAIDLAATNGDYASLVNVQGSVGRNPALTEVTRASWIERERASPDKHFTVSGFCTADYTRDLEAVRFPVYAEATRATAGFARSSRDRRPRSAVPAPARSPPVAEMNSPPPALRRCPPATPGPPARLHVWQVGLSRTESG